MAFNLESILKSLWNHDFMDLIPRTDPGSLGGNFYHLTKNPLKHRFSEFFYIFQTTMTNSRNILYSVGSSLKYRNREKGLGSGNATMISR